MLLFTAPRDFAKSVEADYEAAFEVCWGDKTFDLGDVEIWVCNPSAHFTITEQMLKDMRHLRILATPSTGTNHIDVEACEKHGVKVVSLLNDRLGLNEISASSEFTFKLLLDAMRKHPARELRGKHIGLVGYGRIGHKLEAYLDPFRAPVLWVYDPYHGGCADLDTVFCEPDAVIICCTLNDETWGMVTYDLITSMKPQAALINTARGEIIDEQGLYRALSERPDIRFATDVVHGEVEGRGEESRRKLEALGAIVTPHIAGATFDSRTKAARIILNLLKGEHEHNG